MKGGSIMRKTRENGKIRNKKQIVLVTLLTLVMAFSLAGCGAASKYAAADTAAAVEAPQMNGSGAADMDYDVKEDAAYEEVAETADAADDGMTGGTDPGTSKAAQTSEKIIYTYNYSVETKQFDTFMDTVQKRINEYGGYLESSETNGNANLNITRYANMVIRIPADKMDQFLSMVKENSNVTYSGCSTENVTLSYVDLQSHIKSLKIEQETLMDLLERATKLEDVLTLQAQLTDVRYQLESYESQLRVYDNRIDYATLYLDINEVERETKVADKLSYGEEISQGLSDTFYSIGQGLRSFSIWLIVNLPLLLLWAVIIVVIVWIVRKVLKGHEKWQEKRREKKAQKRQQKKEQERQKEQVTDDSAK